MNDVNDEWMTDSVGDAPKTQNIITILPELCTKKPESPKMSSERGGRRRRAKKNEERKNI